jgi:hypothetical protein
MIFWKKVSEIQKKIKSEFELKIENWKLKNIFIFLKKKLYRHAPQQTETSGAKFKILKCSKQTLTPFPQQSTLAP